LPLPKEAGSKKGKKTVQEKGKKLSFGIKGAGAASFKKPRRKKKDARTPQPCTKAKLDNEEKVQKEKRQTEKKVKGGFTLGRGKKHLAEGTPPIQRKKLVGGGAVGGSKKSFAKKFS